MKYIITLIALLFSTQLFAESAGMGTYSKGYRMGIITKYSVKGFISKSGEGQLLMGREGTPYIITKRDSDGNTTRKTVNPWYFSSSVNQSNMVEKNVGEYVWVEYEQAQVRNMMKYSTDYMIKSVTPVTRNYPNTDGCVDGRAKGDYSKGQRVGRIVKASVKGHLTKSYEVMLQVGNAGNQFKNMSIASPALFACASRYLKSGKKVKIFYKQKAFNIGITQSTEYNIVSIQPVKDL